MKHTKTPWRLKECNNGGLLIHRPGGDQEYIQIMPAEDARHIVKAVNNHDALCELLRACAMQLSIEDGATRRMDGILAKRAFELLEGME